MMRTLAVLLRYEARSSEGLTVSLLLVAIQTTVLAFGIRNSMATPEQVQTLLPSLIWCPVAVATILGVGRSIDNGSWRPDEMLITTGISDGTIFICRAIVAFLILIATVVVATTATAILVDPRLLERSGGILLAVLLGGPGIAATTSAVGLIGRRVRGGAGIVAVIGLPLLLPLLLGALEVSQRGLLNESLIDSPWITLLAGMSLFIGGATTVLVQWSRLR